MRGQEPVIQEVQKIAQDPRVLHIDRSGDSPVAVQCQKFTDVMSQKMVDAPGTQQQEARTTDGDQTDGNAE